MKTIAVLFVTALTLMLVSCSSTDLLNASLSSSHYDLKRDLAYGDNQRQKLDIYYPKSSINKTQGKDKPVIVYIYGGGWKDGEKKDFTFIAHAFTAAGYRVVIPDYRLFPAVKFPLFINDVADAIAFIEKKQKELVGDLSNGIVLMGHSAGAHTAATLATDQSYFKNRKIITRLKALVVLAGPYDLILDDPEVVPIFQPISNPDLAKPVRLVNKNTPPTLLLHGLKDTRVWPFHSERFARSLKKANIKHELKLYKSGSHVNIVASIAAPLRGLNRSYRDIVGFLSGFE